MISAFWSAGHEERDNMQNGVRGWGEGNGDKTGQATKPNGNGNCMQKNEEERER